MILKRKGLRATYFRRVVRGWLRHDGKVVRLLCYTTYDGNGVPTDYTKRITRRRWARGCHFSGMEWSRELTAFYAGLPADEWVEIVSEQEGTEK